MPFAAIQNFSVAQDFLYLCAALIKMVRTRIIAVLDFFYPPFSSMMDRKTFRYAACGGANTVLDIFIYFISFHFILKKQIVHLPFIAISPHIAAFIIAFLVSFPTGFILMRTVVFTDSNLRGRVQLIRYFMLVMICILLNYTFIKLLVEQLHFYPTVAKIITTVIVVGFSYLSQKHFTFRVRNMSRET
jgi:putative flippase GtrA